MTRQRFLQPFLDTSEGGLVQWGTASAQHVKRAHRVYDNAELRKRL